MAGDDILYLSRWTTLACFNLLKNMLLFFSKFAYYILGEFDDLKGFKKKIIEALIRLVRIPVGNRKFE